MPDRDVVSRRLALTSSKGRHQLTNADLRDLYGLSRISAKARREIARSLVEAGFDVMDSEATPLIVSLRQVDRPVRRQRPWWRLKRIWALGVVAFLLLVGVLGNADTSSPGTGKAVAASETPTPTPTPPPTRKEVLADARQAVADDDYEEALAVVAVLHDGDDRSVVGRFVARRVRYRVRRALWGGHRSSARRILRSAPMRARRTSDYRSASETLRAADRAERQRRAEIRAREEAARRAREAARAQAAAERAAAAEAEATEEDEAPESSGGGYTGNCDSSPSDIPVPPGSDGDRDGDGIACES